MTGILVRSGKRPNDRRYHSQGLPQAHVVRQNAAEEIGWDWTLRSGDDVLITVQHIISMTAGNLNCISDLERSTYHWKFPLDFCISQRLRD
jgi:hypothetical protein